MQNSGWNIERNTNDELAVDYSFSSHKVVEILEQVIDWRGCPESIRSDNAPELTAEVIDEEGWFHTGDLGQIEPEGQLRITGRKKEMFKTAFGKYIVPTRVENKFSEHPMIDNILVVGENKQFAAALIVPEFGDMRSWCAREGISYTTNEEMITHPQILARFKRIVDRYNKFFGDTEQIKRFKLIGYSWSVESGELTPTLKLKRNFIYKKFEVDIENLFS